VIVENAATIMAQVCNGSVLWFGGNFWVPYFDINHIPIGFAAAMACLFGITFLMGDLINFAMDTKMMVLPTMVLGICWLGFIAMYLSVLYVSEYAPPLGFIALLAAAHAISFGVGLYIDWVVGMIKERKRG